VTWFKLSDQFYDHPKVMQAGNSAVGLWARCCSYSASQELDGRIPKAIAHTYGTRRDIERLLRSGLWIDVEGSYWVPDFLDYNPSREALAARRATEAERQNRWRYRKRSHDVTNGEVTP